jgi:hypothetical protein
MTVSSTAANRTQVTGNGSFTTIEIPWPVYQNSNGTHAIQVIKTTIASSVKDTLVETTDYSVSLSGDSPSSATITLVGGAPSSAFRFTVIPDIVKTQEVNLENAIKVNMPSIEAGLDKLTLQLQQQDELLSRAVILSPDTTITDISLPSFGVSDANKIVTINSDGTGMTTTDVDTLVSVSGFDIDSLEVAGAVDVEADYAVIHDTSAGGMKKVLVEDLAPPLDINGQSTIDAVDTANDELLIYDASTSSTKKVTPANLGVGGSSEGSGKILQILTATKTDTESFTSNSTWKDVTGLSVSITPTSLSSKMIIGYSINGSNSSYDHIGVRVKKGNTHVGASKEANMAFKLGQMFYSTPVYTTSTSGFFVDEDIQNLNEVTYQLQIAADSGSTTLYVNRGGTDSDSALFQRSISQLYIMEIE